MPARVRSSFRNLRSLLGVELRGPCRSAAGAAQPLQRDGCWVLPLIRIRRVAGSFVHDGSCQSIEGDVRWLFDLRSRLDRRQSAQRERPGDRTEAPIAFQLALNSGGDRHANCALWRVVIVRLATHEQTRKYMARRTQIGLGLPSERQGFVAAKKPSPGGYVLRLGPKPLPA